MTSRASSAGRTAGRRPGGHGRSRGRQTHQGGGHFRSSVEFRPRVPCARSGVRLEPRGASAKNLNP
eukprot:30497-Pelagococcus_subviridis.AAC.48